MGITAFRLRERRALALQGAPVPPRPETPDEHIARLRADNADLRRRLADALALKAEQVPAAVPEAPTEREQPQTQQSTWQKPKRRG
jgi:HEAT repeat protein